MKNRQYRVLIDYGTVEGLSFWGEGFETIDEAVREAQANSYSSKFYIVKVIEWKANEKAP